MDTKKVMAIQGKVSSDFAVDSPFWYSSRLIFRGNDRWASSGDLYVFGGDGNVYLLDIISGNVNKLPEVLFSSIETICGGPESNADCFSF